MTENETIHYPFFRELASVLNSGQSRSVVLSGNVYDLFQAEDETGVQDVSLIQFLCMKCRVPGLSVLVYELNGPIRVLDPDDHDKIQQAWVAWKTGQNPDSMVLASLADPRRGAERQVLEAEFSQRVHEATGRPTLALEFLRQLTLCSRSLAPNGRPYFQNDLLILVEGADMLIPGGDGNLANLNTADRRRVMILQDWFSDPEFLDGSDSVVLLTESTSLLHPRIGRLPQIVTVSIPAPDFDRRRAYIETFNERQEAMGKNIPKLWDSVEILAKFTAGLSIHALRQLMLSGAHAPQGIVASDVISRVEDYISTQLGADVVEFKKPSHGLDEVVGFEKLKKFLRSELIPRFRADGSSALPGAAVAGPIGGGKTFIFEAVASALDVPVLVLKNIRSQWFGQTDVVFERLRRVLEALDKVLIFVDEADTQFGGVGPNAHATERRLTGKIQQMMSDPRLRGRIVWLLMTARIHLLSPDIRRPGRVGDLIIPVLDPTGSDRQEFLEWLIDGVVNAPGEGGESALERLDHCTKGYSAAAFASLRSRLRAERENRGALLTADEAEQIVHDQIPPAIAQTRKYQTLQALVNCTRRSLLPNPDITDDERTAWIQDIRQLEREGFE